MPDSPLSIRRNDLRFRIGYRLGFGTNYDAMTGNQQEVVDYCISSGLRRFYYPDPQSGNGDGHLWSFLRRWITATTVAGQEYVTVEDDFGGIVGNIYFDPDDDVGLNENGIEITNEAKIRRLQQKNQGVPATGRPQIAAIRFASDPVDPDVGTAVGERYRILLFPTPDKEYTLHYQYVKHPSYGGGLDISGDAADNRYILGSSAHSETIIQACQAVAEQFTDPSQTKEEQLFQQRLRASIAFDRESTTPETLGYMYDPSDSELEGRKQWRTFPFVTYNDTLYP